MEKKNVFLERAAEAAIQLYAKEGPVDARSGQVLRYISSIASAVATMPDPKKKELLAVILSINYNISSLVKTVQTEDQLEFRKNIATIAMDCGASCAAILRALDNITEMGGVLAVADEAKLLSYLVAYGPRPILAAHRLGMMPCGQVPMYDEHMQTAADRHQRILLQPAVLGHLASAKEFLELYYHIHNEAPDAQVLRNIWLAQQIFGSVDVAPVVFASVVRSPAADLADILQLFLTFQANCPHQKPDLEPAGIIVAFAGRHVG
jgi:hypothetical protein